MNFYPLQIAEIEKITEKSVKISFNISENIQRRFDFLAGQYVTLEAEINGHSIRRAYSICSAFDEPMSVAIKQIEGGIFSTFANETLQKGQFINVSVPEGKFAYIPEIYPENLVMIATGSGITPILSIIKTALYQTNTHILLVYGNKTPQSTMFFSEIEKLREKFAERFRIQYVFSQTHQKNALFGRINIEILQYLLKSKYKSIDFQRFYICGQQSMVDAIKKELLNQYDSKKIHTEVFVIQEITEQKYEGTTQAIVRNNGVEQQLEISNSKTILENLLGYDLDISYSCRNGVCSSCIARIKEGKAQMVKNQSLSEQEVESGLVLTCQAHSITDSLIIDYDDI